MDSLNTAQQLHREMSGIADELHEHAMQHSAAALMLLGGLIDADHPPTGDVLVRIQDQVKASLDATRVVMQRLERAVPVAGVSHA